MPALSPSEAGEWGLPPHHRSVILSVWEDLSHSEWPPRYIRPHNIGTPPWCNEPGSFPRRGGRVGWGAAACGMWPGSASPPGPPPTQGEGSLCANLMGTDLGR